MDFFKDFHDNGSFERSLNAIFFCLDFKDGGRQRGRGGGEGKEKDLKDFKPTSLVGGLYKL